VTKVAKTEHETGTTLRNQFPLTAVFEAENEKEERT
jgi:hypothetical protein